MFEAGNNANPKGRPKGSKSLFNELTEALKVVEDEDGRESIVQHFVRRAYSSDKVLIALMKKLIADKKEVEHKGDPDQPVKMTIDVGVASVNELVKHLQAKITGPS